MNSGITVSSQKHARPKDYFVFFMIGAVVACSSTLDEGFRKFSVNYLNLYGYSTIPDPALSQYASYEYVISIPSMTATT